MAQPFLASTSFRDRFWRKVLKTDSCWLWIGARGWGDHGMLRGDPPERRTISAARASWIIHNGPVPDGVYVLHTCPGGDNAACVNPTHLRLGSPEENTRDWRVRGRSQQRGLNPLTPEQLAEAQARQYRAPVEIRFWRQVLMTDGCWLWTGARHTNRAAGHGFIGRGGRKGGHILAHRLSWEIHNGLIPEGKYVLHNCDNPVCVNPAHLRIGTHKENMADMSERGKRKGEGHEMHKLTEADVRYIRSVQTIGSGYWRTRTGLTYQRIADELGVSEGTVRDAAKRRTWKHIH